MLVASNVKMSDSKKKKEKKKKRKGEQEHKQQFFCVCKHIRRISFLKSPTRKLHVATATAKKCTKRDLHVQSCCCCYFC